MKQINKFVIKVKESEDSYIRISPSSVYGHYDVVPIEKASQYLTADAAENAAKMLDEYGKLNIVEIKITYESF